MGIIEVAKLIIQSHVKRSAAALLFYFRLITLFPSVQPFANHTCHASHLLCVSIEERQLQNHIFSYIKKSYKIHHI